VLLPDLPEVDEGIPPCRLALLYLLQPAPLSCYHRMSCHPCHQVACLVRHTHLQQPQHHCTLQLSSWAAAPAAVLHHAHLHTSAAALEDAADMAAAAAANMGAHAQQEHPQEQQCGADDV